ncbi:2122_t:CDS:2 [Paraglomus occultum]|uniref:2122_t:CDS:1 n=1 Tax=Paraglomus occultum TaxID=144539 RepID=A0A9N9G8L8_9GLOM|nr:2122_t:CDS:2 [Paraglomus occultum]
MLCLVNRERAIVSAKPLILDDRLAKAAQLHSEYMALTNNFTHEDEIGDLRQRITEQLFPWWVVGEIIAREFEEDEVINVIDAWMKSANHRANILNDQYTHFGLGYKDGFWTVNFAQSTDPVQTHVPICPGNNVKIGIQL